MARPLQPFGKGRKLSAAGKWKLGKRSSHGIPTRLQMQAQNNLGIIMTDEMNGFKKFRNEDLDKFDQYFDGTQYDDKMDWQDANDMDDYVKIKERKPKINYRIAKVLVNKVVAKMCGVTAFPQFVIEDDPDDTQFFQIVARAAGLRRNMIEVLRHALVSGACFSRFYIQDGTVQMEWVNAKYCYPTFDPIGELEQIEIRYVYEDWKDLDPKGKPKQKWYQLILTKNSDVAYDNPEFRPGTKPTFQEVERNDHNLGWVQGEWFRTAKHKFDCDGDSLIEPILDFIDDLNYSLSQSSQAVSYNQEPILGVSGIDEDELDRIIRTSQKALNLGREGKAAFIANDLRGVESAEENRGHNRNKMLDVVRVVIHDPEKIVGNAQSAKAMEVLYAPLVELIDELRTVLEPSFINLLVKLGMTVVRTHDSNMETVVQTPDGYRPQSVDLSVKWPAIFPLTLADLLQKAQICNTLSMARIISKETLTGWVAPDLGIDNAEEELQKIAAQPIDNPFGGFGGGGGQ